MDRTQVYELVNTATEEALGKTGLVNEDLSNAIDIGTALFNAEKVDSYVKSLVNHIGSTIFVNRKYKGSAPSVMMDEWEYGSVVEKISIDLPEAEANESWQLQDRASYDCQIFYKPSVTVKFFNKRNTFEIPMSFAEKQVKESFNSAEQLSGFVAAIYNAVEKSMTIKMDALIMRTINNFIGETVADAFPGGTYTGTGVRAINLLKLYNDDHSGATLTAAEAIKNPDFIRFASYMMGLTADRMTRVNSLFNIEGKDRFTPHDLLKVVLLSEFERAASVYLYDAQGQFRADNLKLPAADTVPYWQGSGTGYAFSDTSKINVKTAGNDTIELSGVLGVMFDRDALGVACLDRRTTSAWNPKAEFFTNWAKFDAGFYNDLSEQFVLFYIAA